MTTKQKGCQHFMQQQSAVPAKQKSWRRLWMETWMNTLQFTYLMARWHH